MTEAFNYHIRINNVRDLELFANAVKDAFVERIRQDEKFSGIRLQGAPLRYNDFLDEGKRGLARANGVMEVAQRDNALQLAGTIIHELAHVLIGVQQQHNENWRLAAQALGMLVIEAKGQAYAIEHFDTCAQQIIRDAIEQFARTYPQMIYDPNMPISWPDGVGTHECPEFNGAVGNGCSQHHTHVLEFQLAGIREGLHKLAGDHNSWLLADEMGLGKTLEVMGVVNALHPKTILVVCPNNVKLIWKRHFEKFCKWSYDLEIAYTTICMFSDVTIINYEALAKWGPALKRQDWDLVVFDEFHYCKTPNAKRSRAAFAIKAAKAIGITGTPIVNYPHELFPLGHYLAPDLDIFRESMSFELRFGSRTSERLGRNLNQLNAILRHTIMTRRLKKDVMAQLPRKRRQVVEFEVDDEVKKLIEEEKRLFHQTTKDSDVEMVKLLNAMKNESDTAMDDLDWAAIVEAMKQTKRFAFEEMARLAHLIGLAKLPLVYEYIENALDNREKVVVFGHHRDVLTSIAERFGANGGSVLLLGGNRDQASATQEASDRFGTDERCKVFVGQMSNAQGYSLKGSSTVIFCEEDWVPGIMTQAEDRCHGIGRGDAEARSMLVQHLVFEDSLDTYKAQLTIKKQKSIDRAVGNLR